MADGHDGNGWAEYRKLVLSELERHEEILSDIRKEVQEVRKEVQAEVQGIRNDLVTLKVKVAVMGAGAGAVPVIGYTLLQGFFE